MRLCSHTGLIGLGLIVVVGVVLLFTSRQEPQFQNTVGRHFNSSDGSTIDWYSPPTVRQFLHRWGNVLSTYYHGRLAAALFNQSFAMRTPYFFYENDVARGGLFAVLPRRVERSSTTERIRLLTPTQVQEEKGKYFDEYDLDYPHRACTQWWLIRELIQKDLHDAVDKWTFADENNKVRTDFDVAMHVRCVASEHQEYPSMPFSFYVKALSMALGIAPNEVSSEQLHGTTRATYSYSMSPLISDRARQLPSARIAILHNVKYDQESDFCGLYVCRLRDYLQLSFPSTMILLQHNSTLWQDFATMIKVRALIRSVGSLSLFAGFANVNRVFSPPIYMHKTHNFTFNFNFDGWTLVRPHEYIFYDEAKLAQNNNISVIDSIQNQK